MLWIESNEYTQQRLRSCQLQLVYQVDEVFWTVSGLYPFREVVRIDVGREYDVSGFILYDHGRPMLVHSFDSRFRVMEGDVVNIDTTRMWVDRELNGPLDGFSVIDLLINNRELSHDAQAWRNEGF